MYILTCKYENRIDSNLIIICCRCAMGCGLWRWCSMSQTRMWWPWQTHIFSPHTNPSWPDPGAKQGHSIQLHCNCHTGKQGLLCTTRKQMRRVYGLWSSVKCMPPPAVDTIAAGSSLLWLSQMCSLPWYYTLKLALWIRICICCTLTSLATVAPVHMN